MRTETEKALSEQCQIHRGEIAQLRAALIACGRNVGAGLADEVSTEFLMHVPEEVRLAVDRLRSDLADVRRWHAGCGQILEGWDNMAEYLEHTGQQASFEEWARKTGRIVDAKAS